jgi:hypothetical protein
MARIEAVGPASSEEVVVSAVAIDAITAISPDGRIVATRAKELVGYRWRALPTVTVTAAHTDDAARTH